MYNTGAPPLKNLLAAMLTLASASEPVVNPGSWKKDTDTEDL